MKMQKPLCGATAFLLSLVGWSLLLADDSSSKEEGMHLYNIHKRAAAIPFLEEAAEAGDVEAMYYLGEAHRLRHMGMTREALDWYHMAAQEGDPYAMLRLESGNVCTLAEICPDGSDNWAEAALDITLPQAEDGDAEAMGTLFHVYFALGEHAEAVNWLKEAAGAGDPVSQNLLGTIILNDENHIKDEASRAETAQIWFRQAAEQEYVPAMLNLNSTLSYQGKFEEAWEWGERSAEAGSIVALRGIASCYIQPDENEYCITKKDPVRGWAIFEAIQEITNDQSTRRSMRLRHDLLTDEQREEARVAAQLLVEKWSANDPALSNFPEKYGF